MSSMDANPIPMLIADTPLEGGPSTCGPHSTHAILRAFLEIPAALVGVLLVDSLTATRPIYNLLETYFGQQPKMPLFWLAQMCLVGVAGLWVLRIIEQCRSGVYKLRRTVGEMAACAAAIFMCGVVTHDLFNWNDQTWIVLAWLAIAGFWVVPPMVRRERTPALLDAILLALLCRLSMDATYYLMHGDIRRHAWHRWYGSELGHTMLFIAIACALFWPLVLLTRRIKRPAVRLAIVAGSFLIFAAASSLMPEISHN